MSGSYSGYGGFGTFISSFSPTEKTTPTSPGGIHSSFLPRIDPSSEEVAQSAPDSSQPAPSIQSVENSLVQERSVQLIEYFKSETMAVTNAIALLAELRIQFGGEAPSLPAASVSGVFEQVVPTVNYLFNTVGRNPQLPRINDALASVRAISADASSDKGMRVLESILALLDKSESRNWSAGTTIRAASLNNQLMSKLLSYAQCKADDLPAWLELNGELLSKELSVRVSTARESYGSSWPEPRSAASSPRAQAPTRTGSAAAEEGVIGNYGCRPAN